MEYSTLFGSSAQHVKCIAAFPIDTACATTNIKCQSRTMERIITTCAIPVTRRSYCVGRKRVIRTISSKSPKAAQQSSQQGFTFQQAFTTFSRVQLGQHCRILFQTNEHDQSEIDYLKSLKRPELITAFLKCWEPIKGEEPFQILNTDKLENYLQRKQKKRTSKRKRTC